MPNNLPNTGIQVWNDTTDAQGSFKDYYNMLSGITNSNMVKIDGKFGELINQLGYFNFYNNLGQLGLTQGSETIDGIFSAMSNFSMALIAVNTSNNPTQYPSLYGTLFFQKQQAGRVIGKFVTSDGKNEYLATFSGNTFSGWQQNITVDSANITLLNGFVQVTGSHSSFQKIGNRVFLNLCITNPSEITNWTNVFSIPSAYRTNSLQFNTVSNNGVATILGTSASGNDFQLNKLTAGDRINIMATWEVK